MELMFAVSIETAASARRARAAGRDRADRQVRARQRLGLDPEVFAGHSLRSGLITSAPPPLAPDVIMRQSRHAKFETMRGYIQDADRFKRNAAGRVGL